MSLFSTHTYTHTLHTNENTTDTQTDTQTHVNTYPQTLHQIHINFKTCIKPREDILKNYAWEGIVQVPGLFSYAHPPTTPTDMVQPQEWH